LSEYYIESLLEEQMHRLNVGTPSEETILFLDGLVELLNSKDDSIKKFVANNEINLLMSFNYKEDLDDARNKLIDVASRCLNDENIIVCNVNYDIKEKFWTTIETTNNDYINFWIHKWISLYILNKLDPKKIIKENLINLIHASNMIPGHVKSLKNIDLSHDSHGSAIFVNLERTILTEAAMYDVNLELADLAGADLSHAQLELVNLTNADLRSTKLHSTRFVNSNLNGAKLSNATIIRAFLLNTDLCFVNMNSANLSLSVIIGCTKYDGLLCDKADFSSAIIDNKMLVDYLVENHASNVPASITDRSELKNKLVSIGESQNEINKLLEFSILPPMD
jgi:uncharacterized protein YjbI with pentapeptide repeats